MTQTDEQAISAGIFAVETNRNAGIAAKLLPGMYVRVPLDIEYAPHFRDFRLGQIGSIDSIANQANVHFYDQVEEEPDNVEISLHDLDRCFILSGSHCRLADSKQEGSILQRCRDQFSYGTFAEYYVLTETAMGVIRVSEDKLEAFRNCQDYDPWAQLSRYEFQQPTWRVPRDHFVEVYHELRNATFGLDELVGARLMLFAHQAETIARVLSDTTCRYILADEVGLGKTIEACVILKGLRRRYRKLRSLIVVPAVLASQWQNELDARFWLKFPLVRDLKALAKVDELGCILCSEDLALNGPLRLAILLQKWDLLLLDEAHHLVKQTRLYEALRELSRDTPRVLILSATPIQQRKQEYLALLALANPARYAMQNVAAFAGLLKSQDRIVRQIAILSRMLGESFDLEDFLDELRPVVKILEEDQEVVQRAKELAHAGGQEDGGECQARELLSYLSENYRVERRIIRNRRVHLDLPMPQRVLDTAWCYTPGELEAEVLDRLYEYLEEYIQQRSQSTLLTEYVKVWMHAAASSPHVLLELISQRLASLTHRVPQPAPDELASVQSSASPRQEAERIGRVLAWAPDLPEERADWLEPLAYAVTQWRDETQKLLDETSISLQELTQAGEHRLLQVLNAVHTCKAKMLLFSHWLPTLDALLPVLRKRYGSQSIARFTSDMADEKLQEEVDRFQSEPGCRILLCDELGGEGRNFQMADLIIHLDLPWTPAQVEQRIGRIDRIGRTGEVVSIVPFARGWPEEALFHLWQDAFQLFTNSISGLEIALEGVQNTLFAALLQNVRHGLQNLLTEMVTRAKKLRDEVEEERYYEQAAIDHTVREEFQRLGEKYRDGHLLEEACDKWASQAGLRMEADRDNRQIIRFDPRHFNINSLKKAKFLRFPDMQEALARSRRQRELIVKGTFDRDMAVQREDLVFFAPGNDPWIDTIIENAICADRGRCCAIQRNVPDFQGQWRGFELFYSLTIDPRPLYEGGFDPTNLFQALGFLQTSTYRVIISTKGKREDPRGKIGQILRESWKGGRGEIHLGKREATEGAVSNIEQFINVFVPEIWHELIERVCVRAQELLAEELDDYMEEVANEAQERFDQRLLGLRFASAWQEKYTGRAGITSEELQKYDAISTALVEGIRHPIRHLESVCFWYLQGEAA